MNKAKRILTMSEAQIKELSPADLNELEEDLDEIISIIDKIDQAFPNRYSDEVREKVGGIKYTLGLSGSGRA